MAHLELIFVRGTACLELFYGCGCQLFQQHLLKSLSSLHCIACVTLHSLVDYILVGLFLVSLFCAIDLFVPVWFLHVPWLRIKLPTSHYRGNALTNWSTQPGPKRIKNKEINVFEWIKLKYRCPLFYMLKEFSNKQMTSVFIRICLVISDRSRIPHGLHKDKFITSHNWKTKVFRFPVGI